ncbi:hypothetical protein Desdi_1644 [Desulfitobacterium dichloroeliminans LMG P-21439]|uniref:Uncharacterized protein n=1 Tax=Desulfitobacterium dichloroeliminans (strain LMG P-21439 / DCA1) TaxID=871963 RepID=L0F862_DESDL|nr:hypothetical protein [Desulfitobacterium dichloroeliminans]AGA69133.1 hypothetical protein Desdi_1644 [Desulfitobacterium dichloroeliminans LMG P-21439]
MEKLIHEPEHKTTIELLNPVPMEVDAGRDLLLRFRVKSLWGSDLLGCKIIIMDALNEVVKEAELALLDGESNETHELWVKAPDRPDEYLWTVLFPAQQKEGLFFEESSLPIPFVIKPHVISLSVWGVPYPVSQGEKFKLNIGAKCSAGCSLAGLPIIIEDDNHQQVTVSQLGEEVLPQTNGTYWTEQEIDAPEDEIIHSWAVQCHTLDLKQQHQINAETFLFRTVKPPEYTVTIEVIDKYNNTPIEGAYVMLGLYKATTDEYGIASLEVAGGMQELYVTKDNFLSSQATVEIIEKTKRRVELEYYPVF